MGKLSIEWDKIQSLKSLEKFEIELQFGAIYFGSIGRSEDPRKMKVTGDSLTFDLYLAFVVRITPIKDTFLDRVKGSINFGIDYTKASEVLRFNFSGNALYHSLGDELLFDFTLVNTRQPEKANTERIDTNLNFTRALKERWKWGINTSAQHNTELGIDLRLSVGAGYGRNFLQTNQFIFSSVVGLNVTNEWINQSDSSQQNLELPITGNFLMFVYDNPKTDINTKLTVYPNLTTYGRFRLELDSKIMREILEDFILTFNLWISYDNQPPSGGQTKTDYGLVLSFGYTF
jgi:hypothetical protein